MPIRPDLSHHYATAEWRAARLRALERARHRCARCRKPNGAIVFTYTRSAGARGPAVMSWVAVGGRLWRDQNGRRCAEWPGVGLPRKIRVVLTVAHRNHQAGDDRDVNLVALCQFCHLHMDKGHHRETRQTRKDAARPLIALAETG